jgi:SAM-dependent methyltransferase
MPNPWLMVPLADYEGHMRSVHVQQLDALSELFAKALAFCRPASVAVLGIAGGNGLERIDRSLTKRVVGIDINASYLEEVRHRYGRMSGLELFCVDLAEQAIALEPVQLVHAALVFEHAGVSRCLENALSLVAPDGFLSVVLQLPSDQEPDVSPSAFSSMQSLQPHFLLIDPAWFQEMLAGRHFRLEEQVQCSLPAGKGLWMGLFRRQLPKEG